MPQEITGSANKAVFVPGIEIVTPLASRVLFWRPRFLRDTAALHYIPFLFWLTEVLRPKSIVHLGLGSGVGYFASCQVIDKLNLDARCYGFDRKTSGKIQEYNSKNYVDFSSISARDPQKSAQGFPDGTIDILHISLDLDVKKIESGLHAWLPKLSQGGVVFLAGDKVSVDAGKRAAFVERMQKTYPWIRMESGNGLLVLLCGANVDERIERLAELQVGAAGYGAVHQVFNRLGATVVSEFQARTNTKKVKKLQRNLNKSNRDLAEALDSSTGNKATLEKLQDAYSERNRHLAQVQAKLWDLEQSKGNSGVAEQVSDLESRLKEQEQLLANAIMEQDKLKAKEKETAQELQAEILAHVKSREWLSKKEAQLETRQSDHDKSAVKIENLSAELERLEAAQQAERADQNKALAQKDAATENLADQLEMLQAEHEKSLTDLSQRLQNEQAEALAQKDAEAKDLTDKLTEQQAEHSAALADIAQRTEMERADLTDALEEASRERADMLAVLTRERQDAEVMNSEQFAAHNTAISESEIRSAESLSLASLLTKRMEELAIEFTEAEENNKLLDAALKETAAELFEASDRQKTLAAEVEDLKERLSGRDQDLELLTEALEQQTIMATEQGVEAYATYQSRLEAQKTAFEQDREILQSVYNERDAALQRSADLEQAIDSVMNSTSWRLTSPARKIINKVRGKV